MRPLRLELEGFASFRERTEIDFEGSDLFVLSGPMGAGKSSIIDAIGFALYGSIVRYDHANLVGPVISQGLNQARVRLDFRLGDRDYTAVRLVRRSTTGRVNTEGRLEREGDVVADTADALTEEVTKLLGLTFAQFTKCVVLPQGDFAELLHAKPAERPDLLVRLLDLALYRHVGERARSRHRDAEAQAKTLQGRLETDLRDATDEVYRTVEARLACLEALGAAFTADEEVLQSLRKDVAEASAAAEAAEERAKSLAAVALPEGIEDLDARLRLAGDALKAAQAGLEEAVESAEKAQAARAGLPERAALQAIIRGYQELEGHQESVEGLEKEFEASSAALKVALRKVEEAQETEKRATAAYDRLLQSDAAYHASAGLKAGETCPVCGETLKKAPKAVAPAGLDSAKHGVDEARGALLLTTKAVEKAREDHARKEQSLSSEREHVAKIAAALVEAPPLDECQAGLAEVDMAEHAVKTANDCLQAARQKLKSAEDAVAETSRAERVAWESFNAARDIVVKAGASPPAAAESIIVAWGVLTKSAAATSADALKQADQARGMAQGARMKEQALVEAQLEKCAEAGVEVEGTTPRDAVNAGRGRAGQELRQIDARLADRKSVEADLGASEAIGRVSGTLSNHLQRNRFEQWYLQEALTRLVGGATQRLWELSSEQYSLQLDQRGTDFVVVDHINANEQRPVRTLSGGETFLASLALALALGDEIGSLAANGAARLDALFLDEGFGALDPNTLETVATTIEELGARGRMVGIITHMPELAERIPVQFRVHKERGSSRSRE